VLTWLEAWQRNLKRPPPELHLDEMLAPVYMTRTTSIVLPCDYRLYRAGLAIGKDIAQTQS
jgi:hypothetical protein